MNAPSTQEKFRNDTARDRVRSCIRPLMRPICAGPYGIRGSGPHHWSALEALPVRPILLTLLSKPPARLAITHISACRSFLHRGEYRLDGANLARRQCFRVEGPTPWPDSPEAGKFCQINLQSVLLSASGSGIADDAIKNHDFEGRQGNRWWSVRGRPSHHSLTSRLCGRPQSSNAGRTI